MLWWSFIWDHKLYINLLATCYDEVNVSALLQRLMMFACQSEPAEPGVLGVPLTPLISGPSSLNDHLSITTGTLQVF